MFGGYGMGIFGIGMLFMLAFWALIIVGVIWLIMTLIRGSTAGPAPTSPAGQPSLDILKTRYAKGEITKEQFDQMKKDLG
ncbi:MAG: SHOCT domain-containing protein [Chloroflexi bacterium]|nr:SHOCT domain-containing protein [Chloroflexota bacterium]MCL5952778.1 SHOCT domain-containing protein [Chloroflexota bacterium]